VERQNVTLALPKDVLRKAKLLAVERGTSLSALLTQALLNMVAQADEYGRASSRHLASLERAPDLGTRGVTTWRREDLHER